MIDFNPETMIEAFASILPPRLDLDDKRAVADYLRHYCYGDWYPSRMNAHLEAIIERAWALKLARAA
jgi:hypothetical protein